MGSFNGTCAVSNLHITSNTDVAVFMLLENKEKKSFCYGNALYDLCPIPFYGKYNDYGAVEDCHGDGLPLVIDAIRAQLYEFGQGPNSCHDCEVNKENFDLELMFEADHEGRLGVQSLRSWTNDSYDLNELTRKKEKDALTSSQQFELDRLSAKIMQVDTFRAVTHVIIHGDVFKSILDEYCVEKYLGEGLGTSGHENSYRVIYFKDVLNDIPGFIETQKLIAADRESPDEAVRRKAAYARRADAHNNPNLVVRYINSFNNGESNKFGLINVEESVSDYTDDKDWDNLAAFVKLALTGMWVDMFMDDIHKLWSKQVFGSQGTEADGLTLLIKTVSNILAAEKAEQEEEWRSDNEDDDVVANNEATDETV